MRGYLLLAGLSLFWGVSWPIMKVALSEIPPWTFRMISLTLGGAGVLFMLGAGMSWAAGTVMLKRFTWSVPVIVLTGWQLTLGSLPVVVGGLWFEPIVDPGALSLKVILAMVYVVAFPMWFCHWAWYSVVEIFPASVAAIGTLSIPVIGVISSIVVLNEALGLVELIALVLVVLSLMVVMMGQGNSKKRDEES